MRLVPGFTPAPVVKAMINIGALMDVPTGIWQTGIHGEQILNGGLGSLTGIVGIGNNFKSTIMHYMMLSALSRIYIQFPTYGTTYDTEINVHESRLQELTNRFEIFKDKDIFSTQIWVNTDTTVYSANKWFEVLKEDMANKKKDAKEITVSSPFVDRDGKLMPMLVPTFGEIDSFTEFKSDSENKMLEENELGESGANTFHMRSGLIKSRFLMEVPPLISGAYHYLGLTAQLGKDIPMQSSGPMPAQPVKKLQFLKNGDKIKGTTDKFSFATNNCWHAYNAAPLINQSTKVAEYPVQGVDPMSGDTDLMVVDLRQLRSKSGPTGYVLEIIVSQSEGVLPSLTEFHFIKSHDRWGIEGTLQHYALDLYPECKLQRTTVRTKIDNDKKLRRALNITAEMLQMKYFHRNCDDVMCSPKELYTDLKAKGFDWDMLLEKTRGWWTINNEKSTELFLSTRDLLNMRAGKYFPYWLEEDKKTIKKQYLTQ